MLIQVPDIPKIPDIPAPPDIGHVIVTTNPSFWATLPPFLTAAIFIVGIVVAGTVLWPLVRALGRRLEPRWTDPAVQSELEELRQRVSELESRQVHVAELEERLDFTERLLTQQRAQAQGLPAGGHG
jgi:hypothetical protein